MTRRCELPSCAPWSRHFGRRRLLAQSVISGIPMRRAVLSMLILSLVGCAAATPGFSPDGPTKVPDALKPFHGGALDARGGYVVSAEERTLTCPKLTGSMQIIMSRLKDSPNRPRASVATAAMQSAAKPFVGKGADLDVDDEVKFARGRLKAYNELLAEKNCKTLDISGA